MNEKELFKISLKESIRKNAFSILPLALMVIELAIIKFVVGTNKIGYAGVTSSLSEFISGIKNIFLSEASLFLWVGLIWKLLLLYLVSFIFLKEKNVFYCSLKSFLVYFCFSFMIFLPNILMHAKSGMVERYLLPTTLGLAFLVVGILQNTKQVYFKMIMLIFVFVFISNSFNIAKNNAIIFSAEGRSTNALLSTIKKNLNSGSNVLLVADPVDRFEVSWSTKTYLSYFGFNNFYVHPITREYKTEFELGLQKQWEFWFENKKIENMKGAPDALVFTDKKQIKNFFELSGVTQSDYKNSLDENSVYAVYFKK